MPSGAGQRISVSHVGGMNGFLAGASDVFIGKTGSGDYQKEMNWNHFNEWLIDKVFPALPAHSVLVLDNAKYHNSITEEP